MSLLSLGLALQRWLLPSVISWNFIWTVSPAVDSLISVDFLAKVGQINLAVSKGSSANPSHGLFQAQK